ncbi:hypothetical protein KKD70_02805, partial [Patescibacteria group bacterium]|nr:hypothetical protein [Patescibacteria group bacterium]
KPTQDKPVYCSDCFSKNNGGGSRSSRPDQSSRPEQSSKKHDELNAKLDKILAILQKISPAKEEKVVKVKKVAPKEIKKDVKKIEKKVAPKKVAKTKKVAAPKVAKKKAAKKTK